MSLPRKVNQIHNGGPMKCPCYRKSYRKGYFPFGETNNRRRENKQQQQKKREKEKKGSHRNDNTTIENI